ncbi:MAG: hypothetical protein Q4C61_11940 [Lachnospiraceae bacterium]|nr:hypothetical protein [Lachnospiraceae bacterium]
MFGSRKKEAFLTSSAVQYGEIASVLKKENISFRTKTVNHGSRSRRTGSVIGGIGENPSAETMYYVYVSEEDLPKAKHLINEHMRNRNN